MLVPRDALMLRANGTYVFSVNEQAQANKISVRVGQGIGDWISVTGDLSLEDKVIVRGGERLQDGQKVRVNENLLAKNS